MKSLVKRIKARMENPRLNENFYKAVNNSKEITDKDKDDYALAHESFQKYKKETR